MHNHNTPFGDDSPTEIITNIDSGEEAQAGGLPQSDIENQINQELLTLVESDPSLVQLELRLNELHKQFGVGRRALKQTYERMEAEIKRQSAHQILQLTDEETTVQLAVEEAEKELQLAIKARAREIATCSDIAAEFQKSLHDYCNYIASRHSASTVLVTHAARLLDHSTGFVISGPSGSGKSGLVERGAEFLPPEVLVRCTSASAQALYYIGSLEHKYWLGGELRILKFGEDDPAQQSMRQLISENKVTRLVVDKQEGELASKMLETRGPAVVVQTTTQEQTAFNDEFVNRLSWLYTSDDHELTGQVLTAQAAKASQIPDERRDRDRQLEIEAWRAYHRALVPFKVVIPYARQIVPESRLVTMRRLYPLLIDYITASALLHQATRERVTDRRVPYIVANLDDYLLAYELISSNAPRAFDMVSERGRTFYDRIKQLFGPKEFICAEVQRHAGMPPSTAKHYLRELKEAGCIRVVSNEGKAFVYKIIYEPAPAQEFFFVPPEKIDIGLSAHNGSNHREPLEGL